MNTSDKISMVTLQGQSGAALITSLLFLLVLTLTGATAMLLSTLEERMSGNLRDRNLAFQAAESALRQGEAALKQSLESGAPGVFNCIAGNTCPVVSDVTASNAWAVDDVVVFNYANSLPHLASQPRYRIEVLTASLPIPTPNDAGSAIVLDASVACRYRITAFGTGGMASTTAIVQSTYAHLPVFINNQGVCHG
jgi:type IV pilus assembly protein PilX